MRTPDGGKGSEGHEQLPQKWLETTVEDTVGINFNEAEPYSVSLENSVDTGRDGEAHTSVDKSACVGREECRWNFCQGRSEEQKKGA